MRYLFSVAVAVTVSGCAATGQQLAKNNAVCSDYPQCRVLATQKPDVRKGIPQRPHSLLLGAAY
jgi:hypothetical protein